MSDTQILKLAVLVDILILAVLSYETYITYQYYKQQGVNVHGR